MAKEKQDHETAEAKTTTAGAGSGLTRAYAGLEYQDVTRECLVCNADFVARCLRSPGGSMIGPVRCEDCADYDVHAPREVRVDPRETMAALGINVREHGRIRLEVMATDPAQAHAAAELAGWCARVAAADPYTFVPGVCLIGPAGVGKTQLAASAIRHLLEASYRGSIVWDRARSLVTTIQDRYGTGGVDAVLNVRRTASVWVLDDVGTEKLTTDAFRILEDILDRRQGWPTIMTSNYSPDELAERWASEAGHDRWASRLAPFRWLSLQGDDRRL